MLAAISPKPLVKKPAIQTGIISASEDTEKPELKNEEKAVDDSKALEEKWRKTAKEFAKIGLIPKRGCGLFFGQF